MINNLVSLNREQAVEIWNILCDECGCSNNADDPKRMLFMQNIVIPQQFHEIRFTGNIGPTARITGRKVVATNRIIWAVMMGMVDWTTESAFAVERANKRIRQYLGE